MINFRFQSFWLFILACFFHTAVLANEAISINDAWVKEAPPGSSILAGYLSLRNTGETDIQLKKVESPNFASVELHKTVIENDIAKMQKQDCIMIASNATVDFHPGGLHLMLIKPQKRPVQGEQVTLLFHFSDQSRIKVEAKVKKSTSPDQHQHHH